MRIKLLASTPNMLKVMYAAANGCCSNRTPDEIFLDGPVISQKEQEKIFSESNNPQEFLINLEHKKEEKMLGTIQGCIEREHSSVMTHGNFTFAVSEVSISMTRQLFRHHTGITFDEKSGRYVVFEHGIKFILPESLVNLLKTENSELAKRLDNHLNEVDNLYHDLIGAGIHREDARYILPLATPTHFTMTVNLTAFLHIWKLRAKHTTGKAQKEISILMERVYEEIIKDQPWLETPLKKIAYEVEELKKFKTQLNVNWKQKVNVNTVK